jgi:hypothetical protein
MARTRQSEPVAGTANRILVVWAVVGPSVGLLVGLVIGYLAWGGARPPAKASDRGDSRTAHSPPGKKVAGPRAEAQRPAGPGKPAGWLAARGLPRPRLLYVFSERGRSLVPHAGGGTTGKYRLTQTGAVHLTNGGAVFRDGGKLLSLPAGRKLASAISTSGTFSVEALVRPADTRHRGPARIVSLSYDGNVRNFTLAQEGSSWVVRLRTTRNDSNGCRPQTYVSGLSAKWSHVVVTYDGRAVRVYLDGTLAKTATAVNGSLENWDREKYPLVLGNEAYASRNWAGTVKMVAIYSKALSAAQVASALKTLPEGAAITASGAGGRDDVF